MNLSTIATKISVVTGRTGLIIQKYSPEILLAAGIATGIASTILACRATLKVDDVLTEHAKKTENVAACWEKVKSGEISLDSYSDMDHKKDLTVIYTQTAIDFVKIYGPAATLGAASIACFIGGHGIMKKRNVALIAAYKVVEEAFSSYRKRVVEEHGEEVDYMYKNGLKSEQVTETEVDEEGKSHKVKKTKLYSEDTNSLSMYARFFDEACTQWSKDPTYNLMYLKCQQNYFNDMLQQRGHVFLNEVYDAIGLERTKAGAVVGWVLGHGDSFVDFGIFDGTRQKCRDFVNGAERSILLDFNVSGVIIDLI